MTARLLRSLAVALTLVALVVQALVPSTALAQRTTPSVGGTTLVARPEVRARVEQALLAIDALPPAAFWHRLGPEGLAVLASILDDATRPVGLRRRAALALRHDRSRTSVALLEALAARAGEDEIVSRNALRALAEREGARAVPTIDRALSDPRALVREGAVELVASLRSRGVLTDGSASSMLRAARAREQETFVLAAIDRALESR